MFAYIKGILDSAGADFAVIETGGVGFKVYMPFSESSRLKTGDEVKVYTYMYLREGIMDLYGFTSTESLSMFEILISVSGVGPKAAVGILSTMTPAQLVTAVSSGDIKAITKAPGIGNKIAQRIILELKTKLKGFTVTDAEDMPVIIEEDGRNEAVDALIALGYRAEDAKKAVAAAGGESVEDIIKNALKNLF